MAKEKNQENKISFTPKFSLIVGILFILCLFACEPLYALRPPYERHRHWEDASLIYQITTVSCGGFGAAFMIFFVLCSIGKNWLMIFCALLFFVSTVILASTIHNGYWAAFIGFLIGAALSIWRRPR